MFLSLEEYGEAQEYTEKALRIAKIIGDRIGEAYSYGNLAVYICHKVNIERLTIILREH